MVKMVERDQWESPGVWLFSIGVPGAEEALRISAYEEAGIYLRLEACRHDGWVGLFGFDPMGVGPLVGAMLDAILQVEKLKHDVHTRTKK